MQFPASNKIIYAFFSPKLNYFVKFGSTTRYVIKFSGILFSMEFACKLIYIGLKVNIHIKYPHKLSCILIGHH